MKNIFLFHVRKLTKIAKTMSSSFPITFSEFILNKS